MEICHSHNLHRPLHPDDKPYGIRVTLQPDDTFVKIIGSDWERYHWYHTAEERDRAMVEMSRRHEYSRKGDLPTLLFEKVERGGESAA
jgi:hypothetical protein